MVERIGDDTLIGLMHLMHKTHPWLIKYSAFKQAGCFGHGVSTLAPSRFRPSAYIGKLKHIELAFKLGKSNSNGSKGLIGILFWLE